MSAVDARAAGAGLASVDRSLRLLEELARAGALGVTQLAARIGAGKATAHRLVKTLEARGYVVRNADATYRLGPRCLFLAQGVEAGLDLRTVALPALAALRDRTGETAQMTVFDEGDAVYIEQVVSPKPVRSVGEVGGRAPAHCVSGGLALLAFGPTANRAYVLARAGSSPTAEAERRLRDLDAELAETRERGYAVNRGGFNGDVGGVAAPVLDATGSAIAAISCCVPLFRLEEVGVVALGAVVVDAAREVSALLGADVPAPLAL